MSSRSEATELRLGTPVSALPGVGGRRAERFAVLGVRTVSDLIRHLPARYERLHSEGGIEDLPPDGVGSTRGTVVSVKSVSRLGRRVKPRVSAVLEDHSGRLDLTWFNSPYLRDRLHAGMLIRVCGRVKANRGRSQMINPEWEVLDESEAPAREDERLRPVYAATEELSSRVIGSVIERSLDEMLGLVTDPLGEDYVSKRAMPSLGEALRMVHQPADEDEWRGGRRRLVYNELLLLQLGIARQRYVSRTEFEAPALNWSEAIDAHIRGHIPFELTGAQDRVVGEIRGDLELGRPMNRLLQGDVGAGKTVVALYALLLAVANRRQGALMAPTELLAEQHYASITRMLGGSTVRVGLLTGGQAAAGTERRAAIEGTIRSGGYDLVIGTQALLSDSVKFRDLAVVVIDEQHRFGVMQRASLRQPGEEGRCPHMLVMTATPIPRSLSLTLFGDLDVSTIDELPPGREPVTTRVVEPDQAGEVYGYVAKRLANGEQAYVVVPAIDGSGSTGDEEPILEGIEGGDDAQAERRAVTLELKNVREHARWLADGPLKGFKVGVVHGRLKRDRREAIMERYRRGEIQALVATTVIEVGVDVPGATVMVIEHAERFGLAQLHQLRGRVGRGVDGKRALCVLVASPVGEEAAQRLDAVVSTNDGFQIAERDLAIRGMGELFGTRQHGVPGLRIARVPEDMDLLQLARRDAQGLIENDPELSGEGHGLLRKVLIRQYGQALGLGLVDVG